MENTQCSPETTVQRIAAKQHGLINRPQALGTCMTARMIHWRLKSGRWVAVHPGVYRIEGARQTWEQRVLAACLATGGVASHRSAGRLWGLDLPMTERVEVTVAGTAHRSLRGVRIHHTRHLGRTTVRDGIPCTGIVRMILDLASVLDVEDLEAALHSAAREGLTTHDHLARRLATKGRKGTGELRALVDDPAARGAGGQQKRASTGPAAPGAGPAQAGAAVRVEGQHGQGRGPV